MKPQSRHPGRAEDIMRSLETALLDGSYPAGSRLPSERQLAEEFGVSRNTVREAIQRLEARSLLRVKAGAGVYATSHLRGGQSSPWNQLLSDHPALRRDILEFRRVLEGATAYFAAQRATDADKQKLRELLAELEAARIRGDMNAEASADARLHEAIALASHNVMFLHLQTSMISMLREHITVYGLGLRQQDAVVSDQLFLQHKNVCDMICAGRSEEARTAMQAHIDYARSRMLEQQEGDN